MNIIKVRYHDTTVWEVYWIDQQLNYHNIGYYKSYAEADAKAKDMASIKGWTYQA